MSSEPASPVTTIELDAGDALELAHLIEYLLDAVDVLVEHRLIGELLGACQQEHVDLLRGDAADRADRLYRACADADRPRTAADSTDRVSAGETPRRAAQGGELCTCGRQAVVVLLTDNWGPVGWCGRTDGGYRGPCVFCGESTHLGERCDHYQLRPPPP